MPIQMSFLQRTALLSSTIVIISATLGCGSRRGVVSDTGVARDASMDGAIGDGTVGDSASSDGAADTTVGDGSLDSETPGDGGAPYIGEECYPDDACWSGCGEDAPVRDCAAACPAAGRQCWEGCRREFISLAECTTLCGFDGPGSQAGCAELCSEYGETLASCRSLCGDLTSNCGQAACVQLCRNEELTAAECVAACPAFDTPLGIGWCYTACLGNTPAAECRSLCGGAGTTCGESGCWQICDDATPPASCASTCGVTTACGIGRCYLHCGRAGLDFSVCRETCGYVEGTCDCLFSGSVRETCMDACLEAGETGTLCDMICAP